ncbi:TOL [Stagonosporopsis vannaccii]|nr:TOL [Stagonosporopsis vannaccii]
MFEWLRTCAEHCEAHHPECQKTLPVRDDDTDIEEVDLPTRVLYIQSQPGQQHHTLCLESTVGKRGRYAALSHCWGGVQNHPPMATRANISRYQAGISVLELPQTFQDAVKATFRLGLVYLWIDSLCIIQDDVSDWEREAHYMSSVYGNAYVTLAASHARNSKGGLFFPRPKVKQAPVVSIPIIADGRGAPDGELVLATTHFGPFEYGLPGYGLLGSRAWCYQEEILSRRLIWFTYTNVIWDCNKGAVTETGLRIFNVRHETTTPGSSDRFKNWQRIVQFYSTRSLSFAKDRPVAIHGLVERAKQWYQHSEYHHGIWLGGESTARTISAAQFPPNFPHQLLWFRDCRVPPDEDPMDLESLLLPSWSWLSFPAPVVYIPRLAQLHESLMCIRQSELTYQSAGILLARGHFLPAQRLTADNHQESPPLFFDFTFDQSENLKTLWKDANPSTPLHGYLLLTLASMFDMKVLEEEDLEGAFPDAYLSRYAHGQRETYGWIVFDDPRHASTHALGTAQVLWILPAVTWASSVGSADEKYTMFQQALVLHDCPDLEAATETHVDDVSSGSSGGEHHSVREPKGPLRRVGIAYLADVGGITSEYFEHNAGPVIQRAIV